MEFSQAALENKKKYFGMITTKSLLLKKVIKKYINEGYELRQLERQWEPGGGSSLFQIKTTTQKIFLKAMSLNINVESKLEGEESFIEIPSIKNEYNFITEIKKISKEDTPEILFYEEAEEFGFLAMEWLESFEEIIETLNIEETIKTYNEIEDFVRNLFKNSIIHTDIHEKNIRFRKKRPVVIDFGETRYFHQDVKFEYSLDNIGKNKYGDVGEMPIIDKNDIKGYTCLLRLRRLFNRSLIEKLESFSRECKFDNSCQFNRDIYQKPDERIYQSVNFGNLKIQGHRPLGDEREKLIKLMCNLISIRYRNLIYMDVGSNIGNFCFEIAKLKKVIRSIGIEAFNNYVIFANALKFILDMGKVSFYNVVCGNENLFIKIPYMERHSDFNYFVSLMSVYHHIENKENCLKDLKKLSPIGLLIEFATQERYYPVRKNWRTEANYIKTILNYKFSYLISESKDYRRPIMLFTNDKSLYLEALSVRFCLLLKKKLKNIIINISRSFKRIIMKIKFRRANQKKSTYSKAIKWLENNQVQGGVVISSEKKIPYPEVTGYIIPVLYQWGEKKIARDLCLWLIKQQNENGSFSAPDGVPYTFDTGQVVRGFISALDDLPEVEKPMRKACDWILTQIQLNGQMSTPSTEMWGDIADDRIHLYVLPPLIKAGEKLNEPKYVDAARRVLVYYKYKKNLVEFNTLSHFYAYIIEALCDLGEIGIAKKAMENIATLQKEDGSVPGYKNVSWVCLPGLAQFAVIWYKLGMAEYADKALRYLEKVQDRSGGFYGSYGKGANYFTKEEISWAAKFFLDAHYWRIKTAFNLEVDMFPESIDENDGRVQEILSFLGDLTGKKVIDVGCGRGRFLRVLNERFPNSQLYGLDISEKMLKFCPEGIKTKCGSILDIKYPDVYFDCIYCVEALEHSLMIENALKELVRILKPHGKIIIIDKNIAKLGVLKLEPWEQWFKPEKIIELLGKYGVSAHYKPIAYEQHNQPDGLFIAWEGVKNA